MNQRARLVSTIGGLVLATITGCGKAAISETRMLSAPARPADCDLELVTIDITDPAFNRTWDLLGYVGLGDAGTQDPASEENRGLVRPRACNMGGTAVAVGMNGTSTNSLGQTGSNLSYVVLRPKTTPAPSSQF